MMNTELTIDAILEEKINAICEERISSHKKELMENVLLDIEKMIASKKDKSKKSSDKKDGKKLSDKQKKIASKAPPFDKITGTDFKALKKNKKSSEKGNK